jgi:hypothetical protein
MTHSARLPIKSTFPLHSQKQHQWEGKADNIRVLLIRKTTLMEEQFFRL